MATEMNERPDIVEATVTKEDGTVVIYEIRRLAPFEVWDAGAWRERWEPTDGECDAQPPDPRHQAEGRVPEVRSALGAGRSVGTGPAGQWHPEGGLTVATVVTTHDGNTSAKPALTMCEECGRKIKNKAGPGRPRQFCSDARTRRAWARAHPESIRATSKRRYAKSTDEEREGARQRAAARQRALSRLADLHPRQYRRLYEEEMG